MMTTHTTSLLKVLSIFLIIITLSCNNSGTTSNTEAKTTEEPSVNDPAPVAEDTFMTRGKTVYDELCLACHQEDGSGVPMMFPPITQSEIIQGDKDKLITVILDGMSGKVEIKGEEYNSDMPPQRDNLNDQQLTDLVNFLRNSFDNKADEISIDEVTAVRNK